MQSSLQIGPEDDCSCKPNNQRSNECKNKDNDDDTLASLEPLTVYANDKPILRRKIHRHCTGGIWTFQRIVERDWMKPQGRPRSFQRSIDAPARWIEDCVEHARGGVRCFARRYRPGKFLFSS